MNSFFIFLMKVGVPCDEGNVAHTYAVPELLGPNARVKPPWHDAIVYVGATLRNPVMTHLHPCPYAPRLENIHTHAESTPTTPKLLYESLKSF